MKRLVRFIAPQWLEKTGARRSIEGLYNDVQIADFNKKGYNIYYLPNEPTEAPSEGFTDGSQIDKFNYVFVDFDLKSNTYADKDAFIDKLADITPTKIVDSGNGIHAYWKVTDLEVKSYLRLSRRLMRYFNTDPAVGQIMQLMRLEGTVNTKDKLNLKECELLYDSGPEYTCEQLDKALPAISLEDEKYCNQHYDTTYNIGDSQLNISEEMPSKWGRLLKDNREAKDLWTSSTDDRSKADYRLGHLMFTAGFTKDEAATVLANSAKALTRAPLYRISYARNIIDKIWTFELSPSDLTLSTSVADILKRSSDPGGVRFKCHRRIDNTAHGFRLGQVVGLVAGSGAGKTSFALNLFKWFAEENPDYHHFFIPLEQPAQEIAQRWATMCGTNTALHSKVHVISNYADNGNFRHLSFDEIKDYIHKWQKNTGNKLGCVVIDHIGALKKQGKDGENQDLMTICHSMKAFAVQTNTLLVMQSQSSREKAGIGDLELNKDAAYGTVYFESYCDYLVTLWQPVKRCQAEEDCPTVTAFKFCKIRHKKPKRDIIQEDVPYFLSFDSETELLNDMTEAERAAFKYWLNIATNKRKNDRKTELVEYKSVPYQEGLTNATTQASGNRQSVRH